MAKEQQQRSKRSNKVSQCSFPCRSTSSPKFVIISRHTPAFAIAFPPHRQLTPNLSQVCSHLPSRDLINVCRTSKSFRTFLLSRQSRSVWIASRAQAGFPALQHIQLSPIQYVLHLFGNGLCEVSTSDSVRLRGLEGSLGSNLGVRTSAFAGLPRQSRRSHLRPHDPPVQGLSQGDPRHQGKQPQARAARSSPPSPRMRSSSRE